MSVLVVQELDRQASMAERLSVIRESVCFIFMGLG